MEKTLHGIAVSPGLGIGRVYLYRTVRPDTWAERAKDSAAELERYRAAAGRFCARLQKKAEHIALVAGQEQANILLSQIAMAKDPYLNGQVEGRIASSQSAEAALDAVCAAFIGEFQTAENEVTRLRAADIEDFRDGLLRILLGLPEADFSAMDSGAILIADELPPSAMTALDVHTVAGIVLCRGGKASHSAILANAMNIPTVVGAAEAVKWAVGGEWAVVDGFKGVVRLSPSREELSENRSRQAEYLRSRETLRQYAGRNAVMADGFRVRLSATVGSESAAQLAAECGCDGIGLLRSEFLYLDRAVLPGEEEQFQIYRRLAKSVGTKPLVIRALDVGGDKQLPGIRQEREDNPFLGCRGIRFCLREERLFRTQLKAILRAGADADVRLLLPMLTGLGELRRAREILEDCKRELRERGETFREDIPVGVMVETAAASLMADHLAQEADFFSIGLNDLTQYILSVDRDNAEVSHLYSHYDPALLRSVQNVVSCGRKAGIPVSACGRAAADPLFIPLLLGFGLESFSVQPSFLLSAKRTLSLWKREEAEALVRQAMTLKTESEVHRLLERNQRF